MKVLHGDVVEVLLKELDLGCYIGIHIVLVMCSMEVAGQGITGLVTGLVQDSQVSPCGCVALVQLHSADVGLQRIHRLILLLIQHSVERQ